ncbi:TIGR02679 family protein [Exiguobacterium sp. SH4S7]|uniref:TIGR02679 family protein n=1 Tax=Exiguobacterium sp. SH4S7 TaxID=2510958 RepID=UPI00103CA22C|nr:TIGR02679 family protein [Exiguobacterium sp. SH4S7]TCI34099.1 TIGR02679 family protein [Exiguobacterium sp. SH4S7]
MKPLVEEAVHYFKASTGFSRLFEQFRKKYASLGKVGGSVSIQSFKDDELYAIARFFGDDVASIQLKKTLTLRAFEKKLQTTKFEGVTLFELLEAYFGESLVTKQEALVQIEGQRAERFRELALTYPQLGYWFTHIEQKSADTHWINRMLGTDQFDLYCRQLTQALDGVPLDYERLPVFGQRIVGNPHAFDRTNDLGRLLIHALHVKRGQGGPPPSDTERVNELLLEYKLLRDDITNYVSCANLAADSKGVEHAMWQGARATHSVLNVPMRELLNVDRIYPSHGKTVWIVENSGVFSSLLDDVPNAPFVCTHGQFKLAAYRLLDALVSSGCQLKYAGDFDPEGLQMAARLKERYNDKLDYWCMDLENYVASEPSVEMSAERLVKLERVTDAELQDVVEEMKRRGRAGYQEALMETMAIHLKMGRDDV